MQTTEKRTGAVGVIRVLPEFNDPHPSSFDYGFMPLVEEDFQKKKRERFNKGPWFEFVRGALLGSLSEALKPEEIQIPDEKQRFATALIRSAAHEHNISLVMPNQVVQPGGYLGEVEQVRNETLVTFDVWFWTILLNKIYLERVQDRKIIPAKNTREFIEENRARIRPATVAAVERSLDIEGL